MIQFPIRQRRNRLLADADAAFRERDLPRLASLAEQADQEWRPELASHARALKAYLEGHLEEVITHVERAMQLDPHFVNAHNMRIVTLTDLKRYGEAIKAADEALRTLFLLDYAVFYLNKGVAHSRQGNFEEAAFCYVRAIEEKEDYELAYYNLLAVAVQRQRWEDGFLISDQIAEKFKAKPDFLNNVSELLLRQAEIAMNLGLTAVENRLTEAARRNVDLAVAQRPNDPSILYNLACVQARAGRQEEALHSLRKTVEAESAHDRLAMLRAWARQDPDFRKIRDTAEFRALIGDEATPEARAGTT